jgi:hypothetical protein
LRERLKCRGRLVLEADGGGGDLIRTLGQHIKVVGQQVAFGVAPEGLYRRVQTLQPQQGRPFGGTGSLLDIVDERGQRGVGLRKRRVSLTVKQRICRVV